MKQHCCGLLPTAQQWVLAFECLWVRQAPCRAALPYPEGLQGAVGAGRGTESFVLFPSAVLLLRFSDGCC